MRHLSCIVLLSAVFFLADAQVILKEFKLESNNIDDIQAYAVGDSVFLTYADKNPDGPGRLKKGYWIDPTGAISEIPFQRFVDFPLCGVTRHNATVYFYQLVKVNESLALRSFSVASGASEMQNGLNIPIPGTLVAARNIGSEIFLLSFKDNQLRVMRVQRHEILYDRSFNIPQIKDFLNSASGLFTNIDHLATLEDGSSRMKLYHENNSIFISIDEPFMKKTGRTTILEIDLLSGTQTSYEIPAVDNDHRFVSYYKNGRLYRFFTSTAAFECTVYDVSNGAILWTRKISKTPDLKGQSVYVRQADTRNMQYETLHRTISQSNLAEPSILVESSAGGSEELLAVGTFYNEKPQGGVALIGLGPAVLLAGLLVSHVAIRQLAEPPGIARYFYLKGNIASGFNFEPMKKHEGSWLRQRIDEYEIEKNIVNDPHNINRWYIYLYYKGYCETPTGALGIYQEKREGQKKLILIRY